MERAEALKRDAIAEPDRALCLVTPLGTMSRLLLNEDG
jgi:hypothetical protein